MHAKLGDEHPILLLYPLAAFDGLKRGPCLNPISICFIYPDNAIVIRLRP